MSTTPTGAQPTCGFYPDPFLVPNTAYPDLSTFQQEALNPEPTPTAFPHPLLDLVFHGFLRNGLREDRCFPTAPFPFVLSDSNKEKIHQLGCNLLSFHPWQRPQGFLLETIDAILSDCLTPTKLLDRFHTFEQTILEIHTRTQMDPHSKETLEIALRLRFYDLLIEQEAVRLKERHEKTESCYIPSILEPLVSDLYKLISHFDYFKVPFTHHDIANRLLKPTCDSLCASILTQMPYNPNDPSDLIHYCEERIAKKFMDASLEKTAPTYPLIDFYLRNELTYKLIKEIAPKLRDQETDLSALLEKLNAFSTNKGSYISDHYPKHSLLFGVLGSQTFASMRENVIQENLKAMSDLMEENEKIARPRRKGFKSLFQKPNKEADQAVLQRKNAIAEHLNAIAQRQVKQLTILDKLAAFFSDEVFPTLSTDLPEPSAPPMEAFETPSAPDLSKPSEQPLEAPNLPQKQPLDETHSVEEFEIIERENSSTSEFELVEITPPPSPLPKIEPPIQAPKALDTLPSTPQHVTYTHSYIDLALSKLVKEKLSDKELYDKLPPAVQQDACRHIFSLNLGGIVEDRIKAIFNGLETQEKLKKLQNDSSLEGEVLLQKYYKGSLISSEGKKEIEQGFASLEKDPRFFGFVYELAIAAGVKIEGWDHNWAQNNYLKIPYIHLSFQALERCLHTS